MSKGNKRSREEIAQVDKYGMIIGAKYYDIEIDSTARKVLQLLDDQEVA
jgi:hypothetical protein